MLTAVARDRWNLSAVFKFCFVLFCYITNHLMAGPLGKVNLFHSNLNVDSRETKFTVALGTSH